MARQRHRRGDIERWLALRESRGLTFEALARRSGIPTGTLAYWSHRLRREAESAESTFVEVMEADTASEGDTSPARDDAVESAVRIRHPSGAVIELTGAAADAAIARLLQQVAGW